MLIMEMVYYISIYNHLLSLLVVYKVFLRAAEQRLTLQLCVPLKL
ncbi:MAG: hypothetical protein PWQ94_2203, partial [Thermoanaerobacterium sp.]|nr:hypothetical protein [Thermoanaerobacterium sp.]